MTTIFLFDVDGVLVEPLAYRAGITKTLETLCAKIGLVSTALVLPSAADISYMEACGIHDVWDITNIAFALILMGVRSESVKSRSIDLTGQSFHEGMMAIKSHHYAIEKPGYVGVADRLKEAFGREHPPDGAFELIRSEMRASGLQEEAAWLDLIGAFLRGTRSPYDSYGTRLFQNIILGSEDFRKTYELESEYDGPSLLKTMDRVVINGKSVEKLAELSQRSDFRSAIYTARPSLPPKDQSLVRGYSPEAEAALSASGLPEFPLVGMGMMEWLARKYDQTSESLTKPNTTQALSAILAAMAKRSDSRVLELAYRFDKGDLSANALHELENQDVNIFVFEDTVSGIAPMFKIESVLRRNGYRVKMNALGIATEHHKLKALAGVSAEQFANVNEAIAFATEAASL